jgi:phosphoribosylanthranilate isomerase
MPHDVAVKICGITDSADIPAALLAGANYLGFVFFSASPRNLAIGEAAFLAGSVPA